MCQIKEVLDSPPISVLTSLELSLIFEDALPRLR
jgi:hypothetical protein